MPEDDDKAGGSRRAPGAGKNENGGWSRTKNESHPPHYTERTSKRKSEGLVVGRPHSDGLGGEAPAEPQLPARQGPRPPANSTVADHSVRGGKTGSPYRDPPSRWTS